MKIGELARLAATQPETVRYYEKAGLLPEPGRSDGNYRQYGPAHLARLKVIRNCRALDMSHDEIRVLLQAMDRPDSPCEPVNTLIAEHLDHVSIRIVELTRLRDELQGLLQRCSDEAVSACGIVQGLAELDTDRLTDRRSHLG